MRIFNWMHRKFHHKDGKKAEHDLAGNYYERETQVLLEQVTLANVLDGWRDGILTIGTFGFDPLVHFNQKLECPPVFDIEKVVEEEYAFENIDSEDHEEEEEDEFDVKQYCDDDDEGEELNPLVFGCGSDNQDGSGSIYDDDDNNINALNLKAADRPTTRPIYQFGFKYSKFSSDEDDKQYYKKRERTTLADLFSADSSDAANTKLQHHHDHVAAAQGQKKKKLPPNHPKKGPSFAKKLENPRPVKKLQQLMRRMMKRKIHPDLEGLIQKGNAQIKPTTAEEDYGGIESIGFPSSN